MQISDYFLLGDLHTSALVGHKLNIDWLCWPRFDSGTIFARLLDDNGGQFALKNLENFDIDTSYVKETAIVKHILTCKQGLVLVEDFMPPQPHSLIEHHYFVRKINAAQLDETISLVFDLQPRPDYGREKLTSQNWHHHPKQRTLTCDMHKGTMTLHLPSNSHVKIGATGAEVVVNILPGAEEYIILDFVEKGGFQLDTEKDESLTGEVLYRKTIDFWRGWVARGLYFQSHRDQLVRSAITMKLLQYYPTGGIVAAPTLGLPEEEGGERNWDYRYVWVRDATFTIYAFSILGYEEEAAKFFDFIELILEKEAQNGGDILPMYTIHGNIVPDEEVLAHWAGYADSRPVRIGNGANRQLQLDVYGALLDAYYFSYQHDLAKIRYKNDLIEFLINKIAENWERKDNSIWEVRGEPQHFTYSKVMCWVGLDRTLQLSKSIPIDQNILTTATKLRTEISDWIWNNCYDEHQNVITQSSSNKDLDATNFLYMLVHFLDRHEPRSAIIVDNTIKQLVHDDIYVFRYLNHHHDGLEGKEGAFLLCSFWLISALAKLERVEEAEKLLTKIEAKLAPHHLMPEELDHTKSGKYLGNYPQAFSHLGYIMAVRYINKYKNQS